MKLGVFSAALPQYSLEAISRLGSLTINLNRWKLPAGRMKKPTAATRVSPRSMWSPWTKIGPAD